VKKPKFERAFIIVGLAAAAAVIFIISCATMERVVAPPPVIEGAEYIGTETCALCHEKIIKDFKYTAHARIQIPGESEAWKGQGCESCHGAGSLHLEVGGGRGKFIVNPGRDPEACFTCHFEKKVLFRLQYHHPVIEEKMSCISCHNPHGEDIYKPKGMFVARVNETCSKCHQAKAQPHIFEHEALRDGCTMCHNAHGSINEKMLNERNNNLCLKCHAQLSTSGAVMIGDFSHTSRLMEGTCWSAGCHTAVHGSNINPHLRY